MSTKTNYVLTREGKIIPLTDDELMHWKYIKREKVNGKWRYYYHDDDFEKAKQDLSTAGKNLRDAKVAYKTADAKRDAAKENLKDVNNSVKRPSLLDKIFNQDKIKKNAEEYSRNYLKALSDVKKADSEAVTASMKTQRRKREYSQASANYQLAKQRVNNSFGKKVAEFLNKSSAKIDKAKQWFKSLW